MHPNVCFLPCALILIHPQFSVRNIQIPDSLLCQAIAKFFQLYLLKFSAAHAPPRLLPEFKFSWSTKLPRGQ